MKQYRQLYGVWDRDVRDWVHVRKPVYFGDGVWRHEACEIWFPLRLELKDGTPGEGYRFEIRPGHMEVLL